MAPSIAFTQPRALQFNAAVDFAGVADADAKTLANEHIRFTINDSLMATEAGADIIEMNVLAMYEARNELTSKYTLVLDQWNGENLTAGHSYVLAAVGTIKSTDIDVYETKKLVTRPTLSKDQITAAFTKPTGGEASSIVLFLKDLTSASLGYNAENTISFSVAYEIDDGQGNGGYAKAQLFTPAITGGEANIYLNHNTNGESFDVTKDTNVSIFMVSNDQGASTPAVVVNVSAFDGDDKPNPGNLIITTSGAKLSFAASPASYESDVNYRVGLYKTKVDPNDNTKLVKDTQVDLDTTNSSSDFLIGQLNNWMETVDLPIVENGVYIYTIQYSDTNTDTAWMVASAVDVEFSWSKLPLADMAVAKAQASTTGNPGSQTFTQIIQISNIPPAASIYTRGALTLEVYVENLTGVNSSDAAQVAGFEAATNALKTHAGAKWVDATENNEGYWKLNVPMVNESADPPKNFEAINVVLPESLFWYEFKVRANKVGTAVREYVGSVAKAEVPVVLANSNTIDLKKTGTLATPVAPTVSNTNATGALVSNNNDVKVFVTVPQIAPKIALFGNVKHTIYYQKYALDTNSSSPTYNTMIKTGNEIPFANTIDQDSDDGLESQLVNLSSTLTNVNQNIEIGASYKFWQTVFINVDGTDSAESAKSPEFPSAGFFVPKRATLPPTGSSIFRDLRDIDVTVVQSNDYPNVSGGTITEYILQVRDSDDAVNFNIIPLETGETQTVNAVAVDAEQNNQLLVSLKLASNAVFGKTYYVYGKSAGSTVANSPYTLIGAGIETQSAPSILTNNISNVTFNGATNKYLVTVNNSGDALDAVIAVPIIDGSDVLQVVQDLKPDGTTYPGSDGTAGANYSLALQFKDETNAIYTGNLSQLLLVISNSKGTASKLLS